MNKYEITRPISEVHTGRKVIDPNDNKEYIVRQMFYATSVGEADSDWNVRSKIEDLNKTIKENKLKLLIDINCAIIRIVSSDHPVKIPFKTLSDLKKYVDDNNGNNE